MAPAARNNIIAGLFILASLALAVWVSFMLSDRGVVGGVPFSIRFSLAEGATGLKEGSQVLLGGQPIGQVERVTFDVGDGGVPMGVLVGVRVRSDVTLYENAGIYLDRPLLGTLSSINIAATGDAASVATPAGGSARIEAGDVVAGTLAPPAFLAAAGYGPEQASQLRRTIASFESVATKASDLLSTTGPKADAAVAEVAQAITQLREDLARWSDQADRILANVEAGTARLPQIAENADAAITDARGIITRVREVVDANAERVDRIIATADRIAAGIDGETMDLLNNALGDARSALGSASDVLRRLSATITAETPSLRRTLANVRLMSDQLKLTAIEVRSQPWRLLYQPTTKEIEQQVLYDATRAYASAASDLRAAAESLESATAPGAAAPSPDDLADLTARLRDASGVYAQAERALLRLLVTEGADPKAATLPAPGATTLPAAQP